MSCVSALMSNCFSTAAVHHSARLAAATSNAAKPAAHTRPVYAERPFEGRLLIRGSKRVTTPRPLAAGGVQRSASEATLRCRGVSARTVTASHEHLLHPSRYGSPPQAA